MLNGGFQPLSFYLKIENQIQRTFKQNEHFAPDQPLQIFYKQKTLTNCRDVLKNLKSVMFVGKHKKQKPF